jgi:MSHA biogenesis protein MshK
MMRLAAALLALLFALSAQSAPFADPTKPPASRSDTEAPAASAEPRLESVLIAPDRRIAVISGQQVKVGERFGEGRVVRIAEGEVALRTGDSVQTLKLLPGIEKTSSRPRDKRNKR